MNWNKLSMAEKADIMKLAVESGIYNLDTIRGAYNEFAKGGSIHIKPSHRGRLTELKARTGKSEAELYNDGNPAHKKMVVFARNARKWKHADGGLLNTANTFAGGGKKKKSGALGNQAFQNYLNQALQEDNTFNTPGGIKFLTDIAYAESRHNPYAAHNSGASGMFQTMPGNTSKGAYGNPMQQFRDMFRLTKSNLNYLKKHLTKQDWDRAAELGIDEYGLLAGAHLGGVGGVVNALRGIKNAKDSNGTSVMSYMTRFSQNGKPALGNDITANPVVMGASPETTFTPEQYQLIYGDNPYALPTASYAEETPIWPNPYREAVVEEPSIQTVELSPVDFTQQNANNQRRRNLDVLGYVLGSSKSNRKNSSLYNTIQMISDEDSFNPLRLLRVGDFGTPNSFAKGGNKKPEDGDINLFRRNGNYFYQASPDSEEITVTPVNTLFDDPALWTFTDDNGRLYTPRKATPYTQSTITEKEDEGPLVEAAKNYLGELQYDINNGVPIGGKYTMPAIAVSALLPLAGEYIAGTSIAGIPTTTLMDTAIKAGFAGHGLNHLFNEGINGYGDAAMTALELAPLGELFKPMYQAGKAFVSPAAEWARTPTITAENAASMTPEQWTAAQDAAIARGDMAEAQRLRDLHFKVSAPKTEVVDINGNPQLVVHKTPNTFTVFDNSRSIGNLNWFATPNAYGENGVFATGAGKNPRTMKLYVNMRNAHKPTIEEGMEPAFINDGEDGILGIVDKDMTNFHKSASDAGKGFMMSGGVDNPNALKSADVVTFDDKGVKIPLGERDNFNINDIRYGLIPFLGLGAAGTLYGTSDR